MDSLKVLLYFSVFNYPLKKEEIYSFSSLKNEQNLEDELSVLIEKKILYKIADFYLCEPDKELIKRRENGNRMAAAIFNKAKKTAQFIAKFPFVVGVGISGSLSKGYYDQDSDVDFFIITAPRKLWIARTFLVLYKKIFLFNSIDFFCINYYITSDNLEIAEKNRFTATELATLIPVCGINVFQKFYIENKWIYNYFGNFKQKYTSVVDIKKPIFTKVITWSLNTFLGNFTEVAFMKITYQIKKIKFRHLDKKTFDITLKSTRNVSKHHPRNFQNTVIERLNSKYKEVEKKHAIILNPEHA